MKHTDLFLMGFPGLQNYTGNLTTFKLFLLPLPSFVFLPHNP